MNPVLKRLRPAPYRGDITAAGAIPLALSAIVIDLRMVQWSVGVRLAVVGLIALLILTMGWLTPLDGPAPTQYHSMLLIAGLLPLLLALQLLAEVLGAGSFPFIGSGRLAWTFGAEAAVAAICARRANSAACTLIAALAGAVAVASAASWIFGGGLDTVRLVLFLVSLCFAAGAVRLRDGQRRHAVALVNAAGLAALTLAATYVFAFAAGFQVTSSTYTGFQSFSFGLASAPVGWELYLLAIGFGLIGYAGSDREPGPAYIGVLVLLSFALMAGSKHGTLIGWPLVLLALGVVGLVIGLRPSTPAPPPPPAPIAPTIPLGRDGS
ncbi:MAG TPA: hypothetical protein VH279_12170 [Solirubrobacteraceae bacterium]|jgi:hypothetical protein|nr:hypothetical protein [Solirubrobacteraceae bacterium]